MDCARPQATLHRAIEMDEATEPIRQHSVLVEASLFTLEPESPEERLRRIEVIAGEDGRKPLLDGGDRLAGWRRASPLGALAEIAAASHSPVPLAKVASAATSPLRFSVCGQDRRDDSPGLRLCGKGARPCPSSRRASRSIARSCGSRSRGCAAAAARPGRSPGRRGVLGGAPSTPGHSVHDECSAPKPPPGGREASQTLCSVGERRASWRRGN